MERSAPGINKFGLKTGVSGIWDRLLIIGRMAMVSLFLGCTFVVVGQFDLHTPPASCKYRRSHMSLQVSFFEVQMQIQIQMKLGIP